MDLLLATSWGSGRLLSSLYLSLSLSVHLSVSLPLFLCVRACVCVHVSVCVRVRACVCTRKRSKGVYETIVSVCGSYISMCIEKACYGEKASE